MWGRNQGVPFAVADVNPLAVALDVRFLASRCVTLRRLEGLLAEARAALCQVRQEETMELA